MKNIQSCTGLEKYSASEYIHVSDGIFSYQGEYVTALSFEQEPELGEGGNAAEISQYPLEDLLDRFSQCMYPIFLKDTIPLILQPVVWSFPGIPKRTLQDSGQSLADMSTTASVILMEKHILT